MKNKIAFMLSMLLFALSASSAIAKDDTFFGIGTELFQDPYNKKVIITKVIPDSPAQKAGIMEGSEIVSVNGKKIRKMQCMCEIISNIRGNKDTTVKLVIKPKWWKWETVELTRAQVSVPVPDVNSQKEEYWRQIAPMEYAYSKCFPKEISNKFSLKYKRHILPINNYWIGRRQKFEIGYNTCAGYSKNNQETCFINLLNRENEITIADTRIYGYLQYIERK